MPISQLDRIHFRRCVSAKQGSHDPRRQVGTFIVDASGTPVSTGTNRPPEHLHLTIEASHRAIAADPVWKYFMLEHAERDAINRAKGQDLNGATMYSTLYPCADCARAIVASGIRRLIVPALLNDGRDDERWRDHFRFARMILQMGSVVVDFIDDEGGDASP